MLTNLLNITYLFWRKLNQKIQRGQYDFLIHYWNTTSILTETRYLVSRYQFLNGVKVRQILETFNNGVKPFDAKGYIQIFLDGPNVSFFNWLTKKDAPLNCARCWLWEHVTFTLFTENWRYKQKLIVESIEIGIASKFLCSKYKKFKVSNLRNFLKGVNDFLAAVTRKWKSVHWNTWLCSPHLIIRWILNKRSNQLLTFF